MGYDLKVEKGKVRLAEAHTLIRELLEFAVQMEMEVIPVNWMVSGMIPCNDQLLCEIFGEHAQARCLVSRPVVKKTILGGYELPWHSIEREHIQGIVFCHHYELWILNWNVTRGGLLGRYHQMPVAPTARYYYQRFFHQLEAVSPRVLLATIDDFMREPVEIGGEFSESRINIECPWRRSDAAAACDVIKLLSGHCDDLEANDGIGVWPNKDFSKWLNLADKYAQLLGTCLAHPDVTDELPPSQG